MRLRHLAAAALIVCAAPACAEDSIDPTAAAAVERTRTTQESYSLYTWNRLTTEPGEIRKEWGAEFHLGNMHRVETPENRIVANCGTLEATHLHLPTGRINRDARIAMAACGINANEDVSSLEYLGSVNAPIGKAQRIKVVDERHVRIYDIAANGALLGSTYHDKDGGLVVQTSAIAMTDDASPDLFTDESLNRSAVPEEFRSAPDADTKPVPQ